MISERPILIAGAGIAGLAAAIGLARRGFGVRVLERRRALSETGAGIQIGPNGVKALRRLGLGDAVEAAAFKPERLVIRQGATGATLMSLPLGLTAQRRYGAPYLTLLRAELQAALLAAAGVYPNIELTLGFEVSGIDQLADNVTLLTNDGRAVRGAGLVGADGLWSRVRAEISPAAPTPEGYLAYRALIARAALPAPFDAPEVGLWIGSQAHVVHYPVRGGGQLNVVVVVRHAAHSREWDESGRYTGIAPHLQRWPEQLREVLQRVPDWRCWALHDLVQPARWSHGRITLIGDAAHPVLPFLAQGAVMALEDAVGLADCLATHGGPSADALLTYECIRRPRTERLAAASRRNGQTYHLAGGAAVARDLALRLTPPAMMLGQFDWLYGFEPAAAPSPRTAGRVGRGV